MADDLGWNDIGYHGSEIKTPAIDKLSQEGIELDRFYVHSVCSPTRASLLTGRYPSRYGILSPLGDEAVFPEGTVTIAELLNQNGYETAISGKWHLGTVPEARPMRLGFNSSYGYLRGQIDPYTHLYKNGNKTWHRNDTLIDEEGHATDLITDEAVQFIEKSHDNSKHFFLYVAYSVPHFPLDEPENWVDMYEKSIANESRRLYAASVTHMDEGIGRIMVTLEKNKLEENTVVLFFSDNGAQESWHSKTQYNGKYKGNDVLGDNRPLRDWKTSFYDGALRVPAIIMWKGRLSHGKYSEAINVVDIYPTFAGLAGADIPKELSLEGLSFWSSLEGATLPEDRIMYWRMNSGIALKKGDWKLIHHGKTLDEGTDELYNIFLDPNETRDVSEENGKILLELKKEMKHQFSLDSPLLANEIQ
ncbi:MAG: sulfatase-like hydrolase/transferase [Bacteroidales bacterium]|nr:sulfatase-like hydrolase/transferase [Bacteroidales bacterium]